MGSKAASGSASRAGSSRGNSAAALGLAAVTPAARADAASDFDVLAGFGLRNLPDLVVSSGSSEKAGYMLDGSAR